MPEFRVNRKFRQRLQSRSESHIVHTDKLLSSLIQKPHTPNFCMLVVSQLYWATLPKSQEENRSCSASAPHRETHRDKEDALKGKDSVLVLERKAAQREGSWLSQCHANSELLSLLGNLDNKSKAESSPVSQAGLVPLPSKIAQHLALLVIRWESNKQCFEKNNWLLATEVICKYACKLLRAGNVRRLA